MEDKGGLSEGNIFFNAFNGSVRRIFNEDKDKYLVLSWIIFNCNYSEEYQGLKVRECYFSYSVIEKCCDIKRKKLQRIMKELEDEGFIEWILKSNSKGKESILGLKIGYGSEYSLGYGSGYGSKGINTSVEVLRDTVKDTVEDTVKDTLSKKQSKKQSIYSANDIEELWKLYPRKTDKKKAFEKIKKLLSKYGKEELTRCIQRYSKEVQGTDKKFILMGSTFFNGRYADYLDCNYNDIKPKEIKTNVDYVDEIMKEMYERGEF